MRKKWGYAVVVLMLTMIVVQPALAQGEKKSAVKADELKAKAINYIQKLYPQLQGLTIKAFEKDPNLPYYKGTVGFMAQNQEAQGYFFVSTDGRYLLIGEIYDMGVDPARARWMQLSQGASERMAQIDLQNRPFKGNPKAKVAIIEYSDFQCPFCKRAFESLDAQILKNYGDKVKFVYKHLPLTSIHPWALKAAIASACAYKINPDAFWGMHDRLFQNQGQINAENLRSKVEEFGKELALNTEKLLACVDKDESKALVDADMQEAQKLGISGTPQFLINGVMLRSGVVPFEELKTYIDMALADAEKGSSEKKPSN